MRFAKLGAGLLAASLLVGLAACGDDDSGGSDATTTAAGSATTAASGGFKPVTADTLTIVTSLPGPGFWNGDSPESLDGGYEYAIAKAMQEKLGLKELKVVNVGFDQLVAGQVGSDYDLALSQVTITPERAQVVKFTEPYFESDQGVLTQAGTKASTLEELQGLQWAVQTGTTGETFVKEKVKPAKEPQAFQDLAAAFAALSAGQVDAVAMDTAIVLAQAAQSGGKLVVAAQFKTGEQYGGIMPKDIAPEKAAAIDALIKGLKDDGSLGKYAKEYLGGDPSSIPVIEVP